jgi:hypothetical protein
MHLNTRFKLNEIQYLSYVYIISMKYWNLFSDNESKKCLILSGVEWILRTELF